MFNMQICASEMLLKVGVDPLKGEDIFCALIVWSFELDTTQNI